MASHRKKSEKETFEQYRVTLVNVKVQPEIAAIMAEYSYNEAAISVGQTHWDNVAASYAYMDKEMDESSETHTLFELSKKNLEKRYSLHREKAKFLFRNDPVTAEKLQITGRKPRTYLSWLEVVKKFYHIALADVAIQAKLATMKTPLEELIAANDLISVIETARSEYLREVGESQDATKSKDAALATLDEWMQDFYDVARIALKDRPQLLETLGVFVRS